MSKENQKDFHRHTAEKIYEFTLDQRYAVEQMRINVLYALAYDPNKTVEDLAERGGLDVDWLRLFCRGKVSITYTEITQLVRALFHPNPPQLMVTVAWQEIDVPPLGLSRPEAQAEIDSLLTKAVEDDKL